ncbi:MAG: D-2-hydroxyacid dehydrogenase [Treponema sp.]|jgi:phosphoglycerate dehydrogenase-like enzyme|nr:D-2-hydroxyacid dehydrogenase [Treponema sp.]
MTKALVLFNLEKPFQKQLELILSGMRVKYLERPDTISSEDMKDTEIIFSNPDPLTLASYPKLKWIQLTSAGADGYNEHTVRQGVTVTNATGAYGHAIAEYLIGYVFSLYKRLHQYRDEQNRGHWISRGMVKSVKNSVVLVVGLGNIGSEFAWRMKALGCTVIGVRRVVRDKPDYVDELVLSGRLDEALPQADIVALCLPGTAATSGLFDRTRLSRMKPGAILINIGRGSAVDTDALCDLLESGSIGGAALDVTDPEPIPVGHRLWKVENVIITPHISGVFNMRETYENIVDICLDNAARYVRGEPLINVVDFNTGYRKT